MSNTTNKPIQQEIKQSMAMAMPLVVALLAQMGMDIVDTVMMGRLGPAALAAGALSSSTYTFFVMLFLGFFYGTSILISRHYGARHTAAVRRVVQQSAILVIVFTPLYIAAFWGIPSFLLWIGQEPKVIELVRIYLNALAWGIPPWIALLSLREFAAAVGRPRVMMSIALTGIPFNAFLNYSFIYGKWGFPQFGIEGVGYASAIVYWLMLFGMAGYLFSQRALRRYLVWRGMPRLHGQQLLEVLKIGWPISAMMIFEIGLFSITGLLMGYFGTAALAAHQVAIKAGTVAFMFPLGIGQATALLVGRANGANDLHGARRSAYIGICFGTMIAVCAAILFFTIPEKIISLFLNVNRPENQQVVALATSFLFVAALFQLVDAVQTVAMGALRGFRDTFMPMLLGVVSYWLIGLGGGYILGFHVMENGGLGLWWGLALGMFASGLLLYLRLEARMRRELTKLD